MKKSTKRVSNDDIEIIKKELIRSTILSFCALFVLVFVSLAWFASNSKVSGGGSNVSGSDSYFELLSTGKAGVHDDILKRLISIDDYSTNSPRETSSSNTTVNWLVNNESNMHNYINGENPDWSQTNNQVSREDYAISPGSWGHLKFSIVSKMDGNLNLTFNLDLVPYKLDNGVISEITRDDNSIALDFLKGHFLFFLQNQNDGEATTYTWIKDGVFSIEIAAEKGKTYDYDIFWYWPQTFSEYLLNAGDSYLGGNHTLQDIYSSSLENGDSIIKNQIIESICNSESIKYYLFNSDGDDVYETSGYNVNAIINQIGTNGYIDGNENIQKLLDLNSAYNQADQNVGNSINFLKVCLSAKMNLGE